MTRRGFRELELYVVLKGQFAIQEEPTLPSWTAGDHFGEESLLHGDGRRTRSIKAQTAGKLLVLRGPCMEKLLRRRPELVVALRRLPDDATGREHTGEIRIRKAA